jgi:hypothetical protein
MTNIEKPGRHRRLGIKIHPNAVGWALIEGLGEGEVSTDYDPLAAAIELIERHQPDVLELKIYASDTAFEASRAARQSMSRSKHNSIVAQLVALAQARGIRTDVETLE